MVSITLKLVSKVKVIQAMCNVQCAMCNVQCAMCNVQCALCIPNKCKMHTSINVHTVSFPYHMLGYIAFTRLLKF